MEPLYIRALLDRLEEREQPLVVRRRDAPDGVLVFH